MFYERETLYTISKGKVTTTEYDKVKYIKVTDDRKKVRNMPCQPANAKSKCNNYKAENAERDITERNVLAKNAVYRPPTIFSETFKFTKT